MKKLFSSLAVVLLLSLPFQVSAKACLADVNGVPGNVDMQKVRESWLSLYNKVRSEKGLKAYVYNEQLNRTASIWSEQSKKKGFIDHKRPGQKSFYDYNKVTAWFADAGLKFKSIHGYTSTENIGWDYYNCPTTSKDCTESLIKAVHHTFDFYMGEKNKKSQAHYKSIINPEFQEIGLGVSVDSVHKKYFLTVHYGTEIISNPSPICK